MQKLLEIKNLKISLKKNERFYTLVEDFHLELSKGEILGIVGESGCGKSITCLSLMGLLNPEKMQVSADQLSFMNQDLLQFNEKSWQKIRGKEMAMIFQDPMTALNPVLKIKTQLSEVIDLHLKLSFQEKQARLIESLQEVGIQDAAIRLEQYPHELSGGMKQRVLLAMALLAKPKLLIADEPTTALDVTIQKQVLELITGLQKKYQLSVIFVTHDLALVKKYCQRLYVMYAGRVVEAATCRDLFQKSYHPYTSKLLLAALHQKNEAGEKRLASIPGQVPSLEEMPDSCRFQSRCHLVQNQCRKMKPLLEEKSKQHLSACFESDKL